MATTCVKFLSNCAQKSNESFVISKLFKRTVIPSVNHRCQYSQDTGKSMDDRPDWVVTTDDGRTIVCWHPEKEFPYECTKPLPIMETTLNEEDSELKVQYRLDYLNRNNMFDTPSAILNAVRLGQATYTNKHRWFPQNGKRYIKKNPPIDREGL